MLTKCPTCSSLMSSHAYESHRYVHDSTDRSFMCERGCMEMFFETADELDMHERFMHDIARVARANIIQIINVTKPCSICNRLIPISNMGRHMVVHLPKGRPFACSDGCIQTYFVTNRALANHNLKVHNRKSSPCVVCGMISYHMNLHMSMHDPTGRPFQCVDGCGQSYFTSKRALQRHCRKHHKVTMSSAIVSSVTDESVLDRLSLSSCTSALSVRSTKLPMISSTVRSRMMCSKNMECNDESQTELSNEITPTNARSAVVDSNASVWSELTALRSIINTSTVQTMVKLEPAIPEAKRARMASTFDNNENTMIQSTQESGLNMSEENQNTKTITKKCTVCGMVVKRSLTLHMTAHKPSAFPCTLGCVKTFAKSSNALRKHFYKFHNNRPTPTSRRRRSASSSSSASVSESLTDDSEDDDWEAPNNKKPKFTVLRKSTAHSQKHGPKAISTPLSRLSRKRQTCTVSPIVRAEDVHEEGVTVEKSVLTPITNLVKQPFVSADVETFSGENDKLTRNLLMMRLIKLPSNASEEERTRLLDLMESCE